MFRKIAELVTGDKQAPDEAVAADIVPMLSHFLPYRAFDPKTEIFHNVRSKAFAIEIAPMIGADERCGDILQTIFSDILLPGTHFQVHNLASPKVSAKLDAWVLPRLRAGHVFEKLARYRSEMLLRGAWESLATDGPFLLREFRVVMSVGVSEKSGLSLEDLISMRKGVMSALDSINVASRIMQPTDVIRFIDDVACPSTGAGDDAPEYNPFDQINEQCVRRDLVTVVEKDRLLLRAQSLRPTGQTIDGVPEMKDFRPDQFDVRTMSPRQFPGQWAPWDTQKIIGDIFNAKLNLPCPVVTAVAGVIPNNDASSAKASFKFARTSSLADGKASRLLPQLKNQSREWEYVQEQVKTGQKLTRVFYSVTMISPKGKGDQNERTLKALYKAAGWDLTDETYIQLPTFLAAFPMIMADGLGADLERMKRFRTVLSVNVAAMAPFQGEYCGGPIPHLLFVGKRGQPQYWSPFQNLAGNHNVAIAGKSGSGKSVLLQDLTASFAGVNAKTIVIDDGRSFEHMAKALGGKFIEFKLTAGISINPFRIIDPAMAEADEDYLVDCLAMLKAIISQMARYEDRLNDTERGVIDAAVNEVWNTLGRDGTVDAVMAALRALNDPFAANLAMGLLPFASSGTFGRFFIGDNNLDLSADLTVFELSDLASREELRSVVLTSIMFVSSQTMRKLDRARPKALIVDEAWQMLKGGAMADFIETYSRTCRKYGASLITATQSMNDYYKSPGALAALENSDWTLLLQQKSETIAELAKSDRFEMGPHTEALVRSLKRNGVEYSDLLIRGPETEAVCRLVLDPFSATLYSSSPGVFARIESLVDDGLSVEDSIEAVAFGYEPAPVAVAAE
jgi:conjugal transfer ATP-binding protein TraC